MDGCERNIRRYPLYRLLLGLIIVGPVLTPYLRTKGLGYTQIMLLQSISAVSLVLFEMPTGVIADRVSRQLSLILSGVTLAAGLTIYILAQEFHVLVVAEMLFAMGLTFRSGADSALLHESLARLGREGEYTRIEGRAVSWIFIGQGLGTFVCSLIYEWHHDAPFWISVLTVALASVVALQFTEPERTKSTHGYGVHVLQSLRVAVSTPALRWTVVFVAITGFSMRAAFWLYEPYFVRVEIPVLWYGPIFGVYNVIAAVSARLLSRQWADARVALLAMLLLLGMTFLLPMLLVSMASVAIIALQQIVRATYKPTLGAWVNSQVNDDTRATAHSIFGIIAALSYATLAPGLGRALDELGAVSVYGLMAGFVLGASVLLWLTLVAQRRRDRLTPPGAVPARR